MEESERQQRPRVDKYIITKMYIDKKEHACQSRRTDNWVCDTLAASRPPAEELTQ